MAYAQMAYTNHDVYRFFSCDLVVNHKAFLFFTSVTLWKQNSGNVNCSAILTPGEKKSPHFPTETNCSSCQRLSFTSQFWQMPSDLFPLRKSFHQWEFSVLPQLSGCHVYHFLPLPPNQGYSYQVQAISNLRKFLGLPC